jgi:transcriptional regulator with XRE-family HTH domain
MALADDIRAELERAITRHKWSLREIADRADIHVVQLSRFRHGKRGLSMEAAEKLAAAIGCRILFNRKKSD